MMSNLLVSITLASLVISIASTTTTSFASNAAIKEAADTDISITALTSGAFRLSQETTSNAVDSTRKPLISAKLSRNESGWDLFTIIANNKPTDIDSSLDTYYAAGFAEGFLLCRGISDSYMNFYADYWGSDDIPKEIVDFIIYNYQFAFSNSMQHRDDDNYWLAVSSTLNQLNGVLDGYSHSSCAGNNLDSVIYTPTQFELPSTTNWKPSDVAPNGDMSLLRLLMMNAWGDMYTITTKYSLPRFRTANHSGMVLKDKRLSYPRAEIERDLRCSSLFKILPDNKDVLFGHATWSSFIALGPRTFKSFTLPVSVGPAEDNDKRLFELRSNYFSSSPAVLASLDDFYIISSKSTHLSVIETTNDLLNVKLFDLVKPESNLCWLRAVVANSVAVDGKSWTDNFAKFASGTYTNQWQVFDMNLFIPGVALPKNSFWLLEEIPGLVVAEDITELFVSQGYWASYNVPYFPSISQQSGNEAACKALSPSGNTDYCWSNAPRANIFRERQGKLNQLLDLRSLINYNDWEHDPLSLGDPCKSIACRRDLETDAELFYPSGATDGKISSYLSARPKSSLPPLIDIRLGPTRDNQPPFCWSNLKETYVHQGQPDCFEFDWISL